MFQLYTRPAPVIRNTSNDSVGCLERQAMGDGSMFCCLESGACGQRCSVRLCSWAVVSDVCVVGVGFQLKIATFLESEALRQSSLLLMHLVTFLAFFGRDPTYKLICRWEMACEGSERRSCAHFVFQVFLRLMRMRRVETHYQVRKLLVS